MSGNGPAPGRRRGATDGPPAAPVAGYMMNVGSVRSGAPAYEPFESVGRLESTKTAPALADRVLARGRDTRWTVPANAGAGAAGSRSAPSSGAESQPAEPAAMRAWCVTARADGGEARERDPAPALADHVLIHAVGDVRERDPAVGVGPRDLAARAVVTERPRRSGVPEAAQVRAAVVAGDDEAERPVRGDARPALGQVVAHVAGDVGEHRRVPDLVRVVQQRLVEEREVGGAHHAPAPGHAERAQPRVVEAQQHLRRHVGERELADAEHGLELVGGRGLADVHEVGDAVLRVDRRAEHPGQADRAGDPRLDEVAVVAAGHPVDDLGEHPVGGRRVVLVGGARLPVEPPARELLDPPFARPLLRRPEGRVREARRVQHHLLDGDRFLAVGRELRG